MKTRCFTCFRRASTLLLAASAATVPAQDYYLRTGIPDHDQIRQGLLQDDDDPPKPGGMYCVPTSSYNLLMYLKSEVGMIDIPVRGLPGMHEMSTESILALAFQMGTDPITGTKGPATIDVVKSYIAVDESAGALVTYSYYNLYSDDWGAGTIKNVVRSGAISRLGYGYYERQGTTNIYTRTGGHAVTLAGYDYRDGKQFLHVSDPASTDGDPERQGPFKYDRKCIRNETFQIEGLGIVDRARYTNWTGKSGLKAAIIDSLFSVTPICAGWYETNVNTANAASRATDGGGNNRYKGDGSVRVVMPWHFETAKGERAREWSFVPRERMLDWVFEPGNLGVYYLTHLGRVFQVDLTTGEHKLVRVVKGAKSLAVAGRSADLFLLVEDLGTDRVVRLDKRRSSIQSVFLPGKAASIHFDPKSGGPAFRSASGPELWSFDEDLRNLERRSIPQVPGKSELVFNLDPTTGDMLLARQGSTRFGRLVESARGGYTYSEVETGEPIDGLMATEGGMVAVQSGWNLKVYNPFGRLYRTQLQAVRATGKAKLSTSYFQGDPAQETPGPWDNVFPDPELLLSE